MFGTRRDVLRRGEYKSYTFRLPSHVPELTFSIVAERGCVCLYASNCAERPLPRMCQWTLLVDAQEQQSGTLTVRTAEHHFVSGNYHVGVYCVADASFSLACFDAAQQSTTLQAMMSEDQRRNLPPAAATSALLAAGLYPRSLTSAVEQRGSVTQPPTRATKKPFIDEGILEQSLAARARQPPPLLTPSGAHMPPAAGSSAPSPRSRPTVGDLHHDNLLGEWHRSLRGAILERAAAKGELSGLEPPPPRSSPRLRLGAAAHAAPRPPPSVERVGRELHRPAVSGMTPRWIGGLY